MGAESSAMRTSCANELKKPDKRLAHEHWAFRTKFAPVDTETFASLEVSFGELPSDLEGAYVRNGPNPLWNLPTEDSNWHWFFGDGMVHCIRLSGGRASYSSHFCRTRKFLAEQQRGGPFYNNVAHAGSMRGFLGRWMLEAIGLASGPPSGPSNTSLVYHNSQLLALCEADQPLELRVLLDGHLESEARYACGDKWNAHPKVDPASGRLYWMDYDVTGRKAIFTFGIVGAGGEVERSCHGMLPGGKALMIHDCGITEEYAIVIACPILVGIENLSTEGCIWRYDASHGARIGLFPHEGEDGEVAPQWFDIEPCYIFHIANAWQEGHLVNLVVVRWDSIDMSGSMQKDSSSFLSPRRYTFDLDSNAVTESILSPGTERLEFPVVNPQLVGRKSRYIWAVGSEADEPVFHRIYKFDLDSTGAADCQSLTLSTGGGEKLSAGEASFIPRGPGEDSGYLVTYVVDPLGVANSYFYVLDAASLSLLTVISLPVRVPLGFHGLWMTEEQMVAQRLDEGRQG
uniref:Carotenoid oxygenase n=1 Tax=Alexandrium monilatum TaxID=311494 RepID=A0A7S4PRX3_9DINO